MPDQSTAPRFGNLSIQRKHVLHVGRKQHYAYYANPKCFKRKLTFISLSDLWSCTSFHSLCDCTSFHSLYRYRYSLYRYYYMYRS